MGGGMAYVATGHERKVLRFDLSNPASPAYVLANTWRDAYGQALAVGDRRLVPDKSYPMSAKGTYRQVCECY